MTVSAGIDIGSSTIKLTVIENGCIRNWEVVPATSQPLISANSLLNTVGPDIPVVATGYGRDLLESEHPVPTISEIKAHAIGARFLFPSCRSIIDIGGQDVKVITLDASGKVARFEMNDRCAAGTGKFLEVMAHSLNYSLEMFSGSALKGKDGVKISSLCTVFAESEIIGLLHRGCSTEDISRALHWSVVNRIRTMFSRLEAIGPTVITGGGSKNIALIHLFREILQSDIWCSEHSQLAGSLGCAISANPNHYLKSPRK
jgi:(R)-2-hydroxyacyl-CoA dehydratese activating ATPase